MSSFNPMSLDYVYYPVSGIMWVWHKVFSFVPGLGPDSVLVGLPEGAEDRAAVQRMIDEEPLGAQVTTRRDARGRR